MRRTAWILSLLTAIVACGEGTNLTGAPPPRVTPHELGQPTASITPQFKEDTVATRWPAKTIPQTPVDPPDPDPTPNGCRVDAIAPGEHSFTITSNGIEREFDAYVPENNNPTSPSPVVFYFHPLLTNKSYLKLTRTKQKADDEDFIAVFPGGVRSSWNAGACCGPANGAGRDPAVDDITFVRDMVAELEDLFCVDNRRIYATGFSNGGFLSHRLACQASDLFAAIAPVSSVNGMSPAECRPSRAMPVLMINGTEDSMVPYDGGFHLAGITNGTFISVDETAGRWIDHNTCDLTGRITYQQGDTTCRTYDNCRDGVEVVQCTVEGGGHCWYGEPLCVFGTNSDDIDATDVTWTFLERFSLDR